MTYHRTFLLIYGYVKESLWQFALENVLHEKNLHEILWQGFNEVHNKWVLSIWLTGGHIYCNIYQHVSQCCVFQI